MLHAISGWTILSGVLSSDLRNRTTATKANALSEDERDAFLKELRIGRLSSNRSDGWAHVTPVWYAWENGKFLLTLGKSRRHIGNIERDPHVTFCVDEDPRTADLSRSPCAVVCYGLAETVTDERAVRRLTATVVERYVPAEARGPELDEFVWFEGRVGVVIDPVRWLAWDQSKG